MYVCAAGKVDFTVGRHIKVSINQGMSHAYACLTQHLLEHPEHPHRNKGHVSNPKVHVVAKNTMHTGGFARLSHGVLPAQCHG